MTSSFALHPGFNVRILGAGGAPSFGAADRWLRTGRLRETAEWTILLEGTPSDRETLLRLASALGVDVCARGRRVSLRASRACLIALSGLLQKAIHPLGGELAAAVAGYSRLLENPPRTLVMGILNVTPDSFSDGGLWPSPCAAVEGALEMVAAGADVIDIGGESTRPGAAEVPPEEELARVLPVLSALRAQTRALISVDTRKSSVAAACLDAGADWINDVSGLTFDPALGGVVAAHPRSKLVLMHSRSCPADDRYSTDYDDAGRPVYLDVVADTFRLLRRQACAAFQRGIPPESLWFDPGFGFGKTLEQNVELLQRLREYTSAGVPVLVGPSRKSTIGRLLGDLPQGQRLEGTAAAVAWAVAQGASCVRVHDVRAMARVVRVADALRGIA